MNKKVNINYLLKDELLRYNYSIEKKTKDFIKTYEKNINIKDINTSAYWDKKNEDDSEKLLNSSIYIYKLKIIEKYIKKYATNVLDIGFGNGYLELLLSNKTNINFNGVDLSQKSVKSLKKKCRGKYLIGDIYKIPFPKNSMDTVVLLDVLEHLSVNSVFNAYKEIYRVLKSKGFILISVPINEGLPLLIEKKINLNGHMRTYTPEILKNELSISGYKIIREHYLYAFNKMYKFKNILVKYLFFLNLKIFPNLYILIAQKK